MISCPVLLIQYMQILHYCSQSIAKRVAGHVLFTRLLKWQVTIHGPAAREQ